MSKTKTVGGEGKEINVVHNVGLIERLEQVGIKTMLTACTGVMAVCLTIAGYLGFQMPSHELATMFQEGLPIKIVLINNSYLGMVRQWQEMFFDNHIKDVPISGPDYVQLSQAYGIPAIQVKHQEDVMPALLQAKDHEGPFLIEFVVDYSTNVFPMVPPGGSLGDTMEDPLTMINL